MCGSGGNWGQQVKRALREKLAEDGKRNGDQILKGKNVANGWY